MIGREASRTALATAYMRAAHQVLDSKPLLLEDAFAIRLLGKDAAQNISEAVERFQTPVARALRSHIVLRSRYAEDQLLAAVQRGISQYVIVGAGLDTFSIRQPSWANDLIVVEVDHPGTQALKRSRIADAGLTVPENVKFVEIDFEGETLEEGLRRNGISTIEKTFFSWLGVTMYLTDEAIDETLRSIACWPTGSQVVLTFAQPPDSSPILRAVATHLAKQVASVGEPFVSYFEPETLKSRLFAAGFPDVEILSPNEAFAKYFLGGHTDLPPPTRVSLASAIR